MANVRRLVLVAASAAALAGLALLLADVRTPPARAAEAPTDVLRAGVGDVVHVGARLVCTVERWNGAESLKCVRAGPLRGTYGTQISGRKVRVFRFERQTLARTLFTATHNGGSTVCGHCR